jgi:hypothetical protein
MSRVAVSLATAAAALVLALPAAAPAARPVKGEFWNRSQAKGLYMVTTHRTITTLWLFCERPEFNNSPNREQLRAARFQLRDPLHVGRDGRFSFHGTADRYGPEGQPLGRWDVRLKGRFTSSRKVTIQRKLEGCGSGTSKATASS